MIYPVAKTKTEYLAKWYNAQAFGVKTSYGYHEAADFNLKTGGDSDLGQPLYAIADGEITSVCTTHPTKNFGLHLHLKFDSKDGIRWAHYAHCKGILVKQGDKVKEGQQIATLGKSGTTAAHLHFAIKNAPTGIEGIAKTLTDLKKWEDPIAFIESHLTAKPTLPLKDTVIDFDDAEGKRKTVGWYVREHAIEKERAEQLVEAVKEAESKLEDVRKKSADEIKILNEALQVKSARIKELESKLEENKPTVQEAIKVILSYFKINS